MKRRSNKRVRTLDLPGKDFVAINKIRDSYCQKGLKSSGNLLVQTQNLVSFPQTSKNALFREIFVTCEA